MHHSDYNAHHALAYNASEQRARAAYRANVQRMQDRQCMRNAFACLCILATCVSALVVAFVVGFSH